MGEAENFGELVSLIWEWGAKVILSLSVLTLIVAGFIYMSAGGEEEKVSQAKEVGTGAIIAATIVLFSGVLQTFIKKPLEGIEPGEAELTGFPQVIETTSNLLLTFVGGFAVLILVFNGIQYMFAKGDPEKLNKAKNQSKYAIIGLIFAVLAYFIIGFVINFWTG